MAGPAAAGAEAPHPALQEEGWPPPLQGCACAVWTGAAHGVCRACTCQGQQVAGAAHVSTCIAAPEALPVVKPCANTMGGLIHQPERWTYGRCEV